MSQRLQAQGDIFRSYHNVKKLVDHLIDLEQEQELKRSWTPPDPGFRAYVHELYKKKVQLQIEEEKRCNNKEKENGREKMDNGATEESEPGN